MARHASLQIIRDEHAALAAMLRSIGPLLADCRRRHRMPDFGLLRAMLLYLDEFPEKLHHTKESSLLFPKLRARCPEIASVLDRLDREHAEGERAIRNLEHQLLVFEVLGGPRGEAFEQAINAYVGGYLAHMSAEEAQVLPLASRVLTDEDWHELDEAFLKNRDPLTGQEPDDVYRPLFSRITRALPAPFGLGDADEKNG